MRLLDCAHDNQCTEVHQHARFHDVPYVGIEYQSNLTNKLKKKSFVFWIAALVQDNFSRRGFDTHNFAFMNVPSGFMLMVINASKSTFVPILKEFWGVHDLNDPDVLPGISQLFKGALLSFYSHDDQFIQYCMYTNFEGILKSLYFLDIRRICEMNMNMNMSSLWRIYGRLELNQRHSFVWGHLVFLDTKSL